MRFSKYCSVSREANKSGACFLATISLNVRISLNCCHPLLLPNALGQTNERNTLNTTYEVNYS